mgnify:FL=1
MRKEKNTIKVKKRIELEKEKKMIKKIGLIILLLSMSACATVKDKASKIFSECPPKAERTVKDILCKDAK